MIKAVFQILLALSFCQVATAGPKGTRRSQEAVRLSAETGALGAVRKFNEFLGTKQFATELRIEDARLTAKKQGDLVNILKGLESDMSKPGAAERVQFIKNQGLLEEITSLFNNARAFEGSKVEDIPLQSLNWLRALLDGSTSPGLVKEAIAAARELQTKGVNEGTIREFSARVDRAGLRLEDLLNCK